MPIVKKFTGSDLNELNTFIATAGTGAQNSIIEFDNGTSKSLIFFDKSNPLKYKVVKSIQEYKASDMEGYMEHYVPSSYIRHDYNQDVKNSINNINNNTIFTSGYKTWPPSNQNDVYEIIRN